MPCRESAVGIAALVRDKDSWEAFTDRERHLLVHPYLFTETI
jgi:hypothetical protein